MIRSPSKCLVTFEQLEILKFCLFQGIRLDTFLFDLWAMDGQFPRDFKH